MLRGARLAVAVAACVALAGCGGSKPDYKYRIAVIPKGMTHEFWKSIHRGADRAAEDLKAEGIRIEILWDGPSVESDDSAQIEIINRQVVNRVSGLVLAPQHSETMVAPVRRARDKGIPTVIIDSGLADPDLLVKYVATNNYNGGRMAAERLLQVLREEGKSAPKLILFRYQVGSESTEQREKGFLDYVNEQIRKQEAAREPTIILLSTNQECGPTVDSALAAASPLLSSLRGKDDKGIDGIFAPNESSAMGVLKALHNLGLKKKVKLVGFDSSAPLLDAVADGDIDGLILQDPYRMGYLGVWTLVQHLEGRDVAPDGEKVQSTGEYLITPANLKARSTEELFQPELQKQRTIDKPKYLTR